MADPKEPAGAVTSFEVRRLQLEEYRFYAEIAKWIAIAVGAIATFWVIDRGKLAAEEFRSHAEDRRALLQSYLAATEAVQPDVCRRKLSVLSTLPDDDHIRQWAKDQLTELDEYGERRALFRETVRIASQLVDRTVLNDAARRAARSRFEQLYWADLPFVREGGEVESAMVQFRNALMAAEARTADDVAWSQVNQTMLRLARVLDAATHGKITNAK